MLRVAGRDPGLLRLAARLHLHAGYVHRAAELARDAARLNALDAEAIEIMALAAGIERRDAEMRELIAVAVQIGHQGMGRAEVFDAFRRQDWATLERVHTAWVSWGDKWPADWVPAFVRGLADPAQREAASLLLDGHAEATRQHFVSYFIEYALLGDSARSLKSVQHHARLPPATWMQHLWWPELAAVRQQPGFVQAMHDLGMTGLWAARGAPDSCQRAAGLTGCAAEPTVTRPQARSMAARLPNSWDTAGSARLQTLASLHDTKALTKVRGLRRRLVQPHPGDTPCTPSNLFHHRAATAIAAVVLAMAAAPAVATPGAKCPTDTGAYDYKAEFSNNVLRCSRRLIASPVCPPTHLNYVVKNGKDECKTVNVAVPPPGPLTASPKCAPGMDLHADGGAGDRDQCRASGDDVTCALARQLLNPHQSRWEMSGDAGATPGVMELRRAPRSRSRKCLARRGCRWPAWPPLRSRGAACSSARGRWWWSVRRSRRRRRAPPRARLRFHRGR